MTGEENSTIAAIDATTFDESHPVNRQASIISALVIAAVLILGLVAGYIIYKKFFKSQRSRYADGEIQQKKKNTEFFDQFNVNDHQATVNSKTALRFDDEEKNSSGIECDAGSLESDEEISRINTGKRVFTVNKVSEKKRAVPGNSKQPMYLKVPKNMSHHVYSSLQAGDGRQYTLALIDKHSMTIHNLDPRDYRSKRSPVPVGSSSSHQSMPHVITPVSNKKKRSHHYRSNGRSTVVESDSSRGTDSVDQSFLPSSSQLKTGRVSSSTDISDTSNCERERSPSLNSLSDEMLVIEKTTVA